MEKNSGISVVRTPVETLCNGKVVSNMISSMRDDGGAIVECRSEKQCMRKGGQQHG
jgi:hypothetical protein